MSKHQMKYSSQSVDPVAVLLLLFQGFVTICFYTCLAFNFKNYDLMKHERLTTEIQAAEERGYARGQAEYAQTETSDYFEPEQPQPGPPGL